MTACVGGCHGIFAHCNFNPGIKSLYPTTLSLTFEGPLHYTQQSCKKLQSDLFSGLLCSIKNQQPTTIGLLSKIQKFVGEISFNILALLPPCVRYCTMQWTFSELPFGGQSSVYYSQAEIIFGKEQIGVQTLCDLSS